MPWVMKWYCLVFVSVFLMTSDIKHPFMCFLTICIPLETCLFTSFASFVILLFGFLLLSFKILYVFWTLHNNMYCASTCTIIQTGLCESVYCSIYKTLLRGFSNISLILHCLFTFFGVFGVL